MKILAFFLVIFSASISFSSLTLQQFQKRPKLVLVLVVDQFRADFFTRYHEKFYPAGTDQKPGGYQYLLSRGAYYPMAEYKVMQAMTCPGHATIASGAYPAATGIPMNDWFDRATQKVHNCVEDTEFGVSPNKLTSSTFGDELKTISQKSKVVSMAIKDRAAVMLGGHHATYALWFGNEGWETSKYYAKLPAWAEETNKDLKEKQFKGKSKNDVHEILITPVGIELTVDLALKTLDGEKLGQGKATDILALSFSSHDMAGHRYGPISPELEAMTIAEDQQIARLLRAIQSKLGSLKDVAIILTGDHGMPPSNEQTSKMASGKIDSLEFYKKVADRLNKKYGKPSKEWIKASNVLNYYIDEDVLKERKAPKEEVEQEIKSVALTLPGVYDVFTAGDFKKGLRITGRYKEQIENQYRPDLGGDVVIIPQPFFMGKDDNYVTHVTGYSYDRYVPLVILGPNVKAGVHAEKAEVIDIAPTISFMLGLIPPAKASGRILSEIF